MMKKQVVPMASAVVVAFAVIPASDAKSQCNPVWAPLGTGCLMAT